MADSIVKPASVELLDMPMLQPNSDFSRWRERQFNRLIQWITRRQARGWAEMMDRQQHTQLAESVREFRDARAKEAAVKPVLMDDAFRDTIREPVIDGLGEWISAKTAPDDAAILYVPGGAFIMKRSDRMTALAARLARMADARLRIADYRLAPEHPCPAAVDDVESALLELYDDGYAPEKTVVACDSAGGSIALAALLRLKSRGVPMPAGLAMFSPWLDLALTGYSLLSSGLSGVSPFTMEMTALCARLYLQDKVLAIEPDASPIFGDLSDLPPILVHVSQEDSFFDDSKLLAKRIKEVDGRMLMRVWPMGGHVWEHEFSTDADKSIQETARFIRGCFEGADMLY
jgi:acetyl esterase/lipase